ncbi:MAG: tRNA pseudouridine(38-40) synthase TruA [Planctomycetota bacterium]
MNDQPQTRNIKLVIAYRGSNYHGWQRQADGLPTVQEVIETAAARVLGERVSVNGASRTDAGVHAAGQVASMKTANFAIPLENLRRALDGKCPDDVAVRSAEEVATDFHASRSAAGKTYRYRIHVAPAKPVMLSEQVCLCRPALDVERMRRAAVRLVGTHDFAGFASAADERESTVRTLFRCDVGADGDEVRLRVTGDGFLYHMVRNIAGTLMEIGRGRWEPERIDEILSSGDRRRAGPTAPAEGLTLLCVHYGSSR